MKNYTNDFNESSKFITKFVQKGDHIKIYLGDKTTYLVPNTEENITKIINIMKEQLEKYKDTKSLKNKINKSFLISAIFFIISILIKAGNIFNMSQIFNVSIISASLGISVLEMFKVIKLNNIIKDKDKNLYFIKNEKIFNEWVNNTNIKTNSTRKINKVIEKNNNSLDINNIDSLTKNDLLNLKLIIEFEKLANFNQFENKSLKLTKKNKIQ